MILKVVAGGLGGLSATGPMTILMEHLHRHLPPGQQYALPPREVTRKMAGKAGVETDLSESHEASAVLLNHFAYGGAAGAIFSLVGGTGGALRGLGFGVLVWLVSYFGLLPAASILRPAHEHPSRRNLLMFSAHLLWGLLLGLFVREILRDRREQRGALVSESGTPDRDRRG